uniref:Uncharacterized protein n=1 Tax=Haptolina brevifila TaxID=156173 RepID=A0A7S2BMW6_9EUKA
MAGARAGQGGAPGAQGERALPCDRLTWDGNEHEHIVILRAVARHHTTAVALSTRVSVPRFRATPALGPSERWSWRRSGSVMGRTASRLLAPSTRVSDFEFRSRGAQRADQMLKMRGVDYAKADFSIARAWLVHARGKVVLLALRASARCRAIA